MEDYYNGTKLLSLKDINRNDPDLYICTSNRTGGKTTYFGRYIFNRWIKYKEKFCLFYRFKNELASVEKKFFKDIGPLFFNGWEMISRSQMEGMYKSLYTISPNSDIPTECGYAVALNSSSQIKNYSHLFSDVTRIFFDEFQAENNHYCTDELSKFISLHTSIARGQGKQSKRVPVIMLGNPISLLNPYYVELGVSERLKSDTKFLRGEGYVLEQGYVKSAADAQNNSGFNRAFKSHKYTSYAAEGIYLNDEHAFIDKLTGKSNYLCTIKYENQNYAIRDFPELGIIYADDHPDLSFKFKLAATVDDHDINYTLIINNQLLQGYLRYYFERGLFRFKNLKCKAAILRTLSY